MIDYINLTSGLELLPSYPDARFVRIQSSQFESGAWWTALADLDYDFLFSAATVGARLIDCGSRKASGVSRAQWQGVPWFQYCYARVNNLAIATNPNYRRAFEEKYDLWSSDTQGAQDRAIKRLKYIYKMTSAELLAIECINGVSTMDGNYEAFRGVIVGQVR